MLMKHDTDPAKEIVKKAGDLKDFTIYGNQILVGVYLRPEKSKDIKRDDGTVANFYLPDVVRKEDEHQGKAALVLKLGPSAFVTDANYDFRGQSVKVGDWIAIFVSDGRKVMIRDQLCRIVEDHHIRLKIPAPDLVY
jgi:hypothetical protein